MSFPPIKMVITFQSFWKSTRWNDTKTFTHSLFICEIRVNLFICEGVSVFWNPGNDSPNQFSFLKQQHELAWPYHCNITKLDFSQNIFFGNTEELNSSKHLVPCSLDEMSYSLGFGPRYGLVQKTLGRILTSLSQWITNKWRVKLFQNI